jgi:phenylacetate-CoA ligase
VKSKAEDCFRYIYDTSPVWAQHALVTAKGLHFRYWRNSDRALRQFYAFLKESERWTIERYRQYQLAQLKNVVERAASAVPWYRTMFRRIGFDPLDLTSLQHVKQLPILSKDELRGNETQFMHEQLAKKPFTRVFTSGSTGTPINSFETRNSFSRRMAFVARLRSWVGLADPFYPRRAQFTGRSLVPEREKKEKHVYWRANLAGNSLLFSTIHLSEETVSHYVSAMVKHHPVLVDGYPSAMLILARLARAAGLSLPKPQALICTAETLTPDARAEIQTAFGAPIFNQYAASEPSCFWCECEHGVIHQNLEYGVSEIVGPDGNEVAEGETGEVVVTSFLNPLFPLIRYRLGDLAELGPRSTCACQREMPRIRSIKGRTDDILFIPGRGYLGRLDSVFKEVPHCHEAQIVHESPLHLRILVVPTRHFSMEQRSSLVANLRQKVGYEAHIDLETVDRIPRGPNGKFRTVVSKTTKLQ